MVTSFKKSTSRTLRKKRAHWQKTFGGADQPLPPHPVPEGLFFYQWLWKINFSLFLTCCIVNWFTFVQKSILLSSWNYKVTFLYTEEIHLCSNTHHQLQYALSSGIIINLFQAFQLLSWFQVFRLQLIIAYISSRNAWHRYIFIPLISVCCSWWWLIFLCKLKVISCSLNHSQNIQIWKNLCLFGAFTLINSRGISL